MHKLFLLIILLFSFTISSYAAHCPISSDFVQISRWYPFPGYYWDLTTDAQNDWKIRDKRFITANSSSFPNESTLIVTVSPHAGHIVCLYVLPDRTAFVVNSKSHKKANLNKIDLSLFIPKHQSNNPEPSKNHHWQEDYSITSLECKGNNVTAANPEYCHWEWA